MPNGSIFEPFQLLKMKNLRNTLDISKYVTCSAKTVFKLISEVYSTQSCVSSAIYSFNGQALNCLIHFIFEWTPCVWCSTGHPNLHSPSWCWEKLFQHHLWIRVMMVDPTLFQSTPSNIIYEWFKVALPRCWPLWVKHRDPLQNSKDCINNNLH